MGAHFSAKDIDRFCAQMRKSIITQATNDPSDAAFTRAAKELLPGFVRWMLEEINRGTSNEIMGGAIQHLLASMLAQSFAGGVREEGRLTPDIIKQIGLLSAAIGFQACEIAKGNETAAPDDLIVTGEMGGHA